MSTSSTPAPIIDCEQHHAGLVASDVDEAVEFYTKKLGFTLAFKEREPGQSSNFAGVNLDCAQIFLRKGTPHPEGVGTYFLVGNADELYEFHHANGVEVFQPPQDQPYGIRDYVIRDLYGHYLCFGHRLFNVGQKLKIERVNVPMRLEKRLAALLNDLAAFKRMSLTSCLEEILLHTCEPHGDGVASPHSKRDLRYIQELKNKHGIDYDRHASYRFEE